MNSISSLLRIICGLALIILSYITYRNTVVNAEPGSKTLILGMATDASPGQLTFGLAVIGLIGAGLLALGVGGLMKGRR